MSQDNINNELNDELDEEYDFANMTGGVRGKYAQAYQEGTNLVLLEPDVAKVFKSDEAVNKALRLLMEIAQNQLS